MKKDIILSVMVAGIVFGQSAYAMDSLEGAGSSSSETKESKSLVSVLEGGEKDNSEKVDSNASSAFDFSAFSSLNSVSQAPVRKPAKTSSSSSSPFDFSAFSSLNSVPYKEEERGAKSPESELTEEVLDSILVVESSTGEIDLEATYQKRIATIEEYFKRISEAIDAKIKKNEERMDKWKELKASSSERYEQLQQSIEEEANYSDDEEYSVHAANYKGDLGAYESKLQQAEQNIEKLSSEAKQLVFEKSRLMSSSNAKSLNRYLNKVKLMLAQAKLDREKREEFARMRAEHEKLVEIANITVDQNTVDELIARDKQREDQEKMLSEQLKSTSFGGEEDAEEFDNQVSDAGEEEDEGLEGKVSEAEEDDQGGLN